MGFKGAWGTFYHIPKCGGISMRYFLKAHFHDAGIDYGKQHELPQPGDNLENAFTIVRHPADWLLSYYAYMESHDWRWPECPKEIRDLFAFADGMFWPLWVQAVSAQAPGAVGRVYGLYCLPGVKVYKLEEIDDIFGMEVGIKNVTEIAPVMRLSHWQRLCEAERETRARYGYGDQPGANVRV